MKVAILGTRGIPARYGGFETLAEQLANRLVERGHEVTVYCRRPFTTPADVVDPRIRRVVLPTISRKHLDTLFHTFLSVFDVGFRGADLVLLCNVGNSPLAWIPRIFGKPTILHVDGLDRERRKWSSFARFYLLMCEWIATLTPTQLVTDARVIQDYYRDRYGQDSCMVAYGAEVPQDVGEPAFGLPAGRYLLYVARLEPENNPELIIHAYNRLKTDWPLAIVGGNKYVPAYVESLKAIAGPNVRFLGPVYGDGYWNLQKHAGMFLFGGEVGGVHPSLVESMAVGNPILYLDTVQNREAVAGCGVPYPNDPAALAGKIQMLIDSEATRQELRLKAAAHASEIYSWSRIVEQYERLFQEVLLARAGAPVAASPDR
jgi:glycosyltransferase involved in cell wall biosynthesis